MLEGGRRAWPKATAPSPEREKNCSLENELVLVGRLAESEQKAFERVASQQNLEGFARLPAEVEQSLADRGRWILGFAFLHVGDSR